MLINFFYFSNHTPFFLRLDSRVYYSTIDGKKFCRSKETKVSYESGWKFCHILRLSKLYSRGLRVKLGLIISKTWLTLHLRWVSEVNELRAQSQTPKRSRTDPRHLSTTFSCNYKTSGTRLSRRRNYRIIYRILRVCHYRKIPPVSSRGRKR